MRKLHIIIMVVSALILLSSSCKNTKEAAAADAIGDAKSSEQMKDDKNTTPEIESVIVDPTYKAQKTDPFNLLSAETNGDILTLLVQYGGGCEDHEWALKTNGAYAKSLPPQITLNIEHNSNKDMCRALLTDTLQFNLEPIQYPGTGELIVKLSNFEKTRINYQYSKKN